MQDFHLMRFKHLNGSMRILLKFTLNWRIYFEVFLPLTPHTWEEVREERGPPAWVSLQEVGQSWLSLWLSQPSPPARSGLRPGFFSFETFLVWCETIYLYNKFRRGKTQRYRLGLKMGPSAFCHVLLNKPGILVFLKKPCISHIIIWRPDGRLGLDPEGPLLVCGTSPGFHY